MALRELLTLNLLIATTACSPAGPEVTAPGPLSSERAAIRATGHCVLRLSDVTIQGSTITLGPSACKTSNWFEPEKQTPETVEVQCLRDVLQTKEPYIKVAEAGAEEAEYLLADEALLINLQRRGVPACITSSNGN